jgi:hypothetical protein
MTARFILKTGHLNKVPGSVPEKQRTPISGTQLGTSITFKLLGQMTSNLNHSWLYKFRTTLI